jgi:hypothetical protein
VTFIANFIPFEAPYGGPNFFKFDDNVLYEIMVDNNGDAVEDVTFQFTFRTDVRNRIRSSTTPAHHVARFDDVQRPAVLLRDRVDGPRRRGRGTVLATDLPTPPVNVGFRSTPNYEALAAAAVRPLPNGAQSLRRPARRSVLRRSERVRPARRAAGSIPTTSMARRLQRPHHRDRSAHLFADGERCTSVIGVGPERRHRRVVYR